MKQIEIAPGFVVQIDDQDFDRVQSKHWYVTNRIIRPYAITSIRNSKGNKSFIRIGRFLLNPPKDCVVAHIDKNPWNCQRANLVILTKKEFCARRSPHIDNQTSFKGVSKHLNGFIASIYANGKSIYLGSFTTPEEAAKTYDRAALLARGPYAYLNFPEDYVK